MSHATDPSRRDALRLLSGVPFLPLAGTALTVLAGCATGPGRPMAVAAELIGMDAPATPETQATTHIASALQVTYRDGVTQRIALGFRPILMTGDAVPDGTGGTAIAGGYHDIAGRPIMDTSGPAPAQFYSDCPDGVSLIARPGARVAGVSGNPVFAVVQFEYISRDARGAELGTSLPAPIAVLTLDQDPFDGALRLVKYHTVDTAKAHGLWITCGASLSPWNTHLASEEYEPNAPAVSGSGYDADPATLRYVARFRRFSRYLFGNETAANPYHYGHLPEVSVNSDGTGAIRKHYCLGRISHEVIEVMPDRRTALMGDDAANGGLFMFVADRPDDLSAGTLYVARATQRPGTDMEAGGAFDLDWVRLGHATSAEIEALADRLKPDDILDARTKDPGDAGFTAIPFNGTREWVRFKPGMEKAAAFLETHRWAPIAGGTLAFSKMEGVTLDARDKVAYVAMSSITKSMCDDSAGIRVQEIKSGAVYRMPLAGGRRDIAGTAIDSQWVPVRMAAVPALVGRDLPTPDALGNTSDPERVSQPDNLKFSQELRVLFIGEDSTMHVNNFLWAYHVDSGKLTRLMSFPAGAEATGLQAVADVNGFAYVMTGFQHPGDWQKGVHDKLRPALAPLIDARYRGRASAAFGYIEGFPVLPGVRPMV